MMTGPGDEKAAGGADRGHIRASHADREQVIAALRAAFIQGRLTRDEFDLRVGRALGARTYAELAALTADIPAGQTSPVARNAPQADVRPRRRRRSAGIAATAAFIALIAALIPVLTATFGRPGPAGHGSQATVYVAYYIPHGVKVSGAVIPVNTVTNQAGKPIKVNTGQITINPNGKTAYAVNEAAGTVIPIRTAANTPGQPIQVARRPPSFGPHAIGPDFIAITPDGKTGYVADPGMNTVIPISTATSTAGKPIHLPQGGYGPDWIAITPDGRTAYVANDSQPGTITPINTATNQAGKPIRVGGAFPSQIAITPDGKTAYVLGRSTSGHTKGKVTPVNTATNTPGKPIYLPWLRGKGSTGIAIAITPDGKTAYVSTDYPRTVVPIRTATNTAGKPITINGPDPPDGGEIAITPDGKTAYVLSGREFGHPDPHGHHPGLPIRLGSSCRSELLAVPEYRIVITPDGKTAYVACEGAVVPIRTATNTVGRPIHIPLGYAMGIAITP